ncbi:VOC family protein [soil metagenome]
MTVQLSPYLNFRTEAREAMEFYKSVLGGDLIVSTFADFQAPVEDSEKDLVMHSQLTTPIGLLLMGADTPSQMEYRPAGGFAVSLSGDDEAELTAYWNRLSAGAEIQEPLEKAPWGDSFGMLTDKFGVAWLVNISATAA